MWTHCLMCGAALSWSQLDGTCHSMVMKMKMKVAHRSPHRSKHIQQQTVNPTPSIMPEWRLLCWLGQTHLVFEDVKFTHGAGGVFQQPRLNALLMVEMSGKENFHYSFFLLFNSFLKTKQNQKRKTEKTTSAVHI